MVLVVLLFGILFLPALAKMIGAIGNSEHLTDNAKLIVIVVILLFLLYGWIQA